MFLYLLCGAAFQSRDTWILEPVDATAEASENT